MVRVSRRAPTAATSRRAAWGCASGRRLPPVRSRASRRSQSSVTPSTARGTAPMDWGTAPEDHGLAPKDRGTAPKDRGASPGSQVPQSRGRARCRTPVARPREPGPVPQSRGRPRGPPRRPEPQSSENEPFGEGFGRLPERPPERGFCPGGGDAGQSQVPYPNQKVCIWCRIPRIPILSARTPIPLLRTLNFRQNFAKILGFFFGAHHGNDLVHLVPCFTGEEALRTNRPHAGTTILLTKDKSKC